jgi:hypothetical protein
MQAEGSLSRGTPGRVASSPDKAGTDQHRQMVSVPSEYSPFVPK